MKINHILLFACLIKFLISIQTSAQTAYYKQYQVKDGLPSNQCYFAHQDKQGYMWFCTDRGLVKYDGTNFINVSMKSDLVDQTIFEVCENEKGDIVFITFSGNIYHNPSGTDSIIKLSIPQWLQQDLMGQKSYITFGKSNTLYISKLFNQIYYFDINCPSAIQKLPLSSKKNTFYIKEIEPGEFISTSLIPFFNTYNKIDKQLTETYFEEIYYQNMQGKIITLKINIPVNLSNTLVYIKKIGNNKLAISIGAELFLTHDSVITYHKRFPDGISALYFDKNKSQLFIGAMKGPFCIYSYKHGKLKLSETIFTNKTITVPIIDNEGSLWAPSMWSGIFYFPYAGRIKCLADATIRKFSINNFKAFQEYQYLSTNEGHIYNVSDTNTHFLKKIPTPKTSVPPIIMWVDTKMVLINVPGKKNAFQYKHHPFHIFSEAFFNKNSNQRKTAFIDGNYWLQFLDQSHAWLENKRFVRLLKYNTSNEKLIQSPSIYTGAAMLTNICKWNERYWWGHLGGLNSTDSMLTEIRSHSTFNYRIQHLIASKNDLWIISRNKGVTLYNKTGQVFTFNSENGLSSNLCNHAHRDQFNRLWVATTKGVNVIIKKPVTGYQVINVGRKMGLSSIDAKYVHTHKSNIWIYTTNQIYKARMDDIFEDKPESRIVLSGLNINYLEKEAIKNHLLSYSQNNMGLKLSVLSFLNNQNITYQYRLNGYQNTWIETNSPSITFSKLPPAKYALEARYLKEDNNWSQSSTIFTATILPAFWQRTEFLLLVSFLSIILIYLFVKWRVQAKYKAKTFQLQLAHARKKALISQMNPHFIFNALNSIQRFINLHENERANHFLTQFSKLMRRVISNSEKELISLEEEIEALKNYLSIEKQRFGDKLKYNIHVSNEFNINSFKISPLLVQPFVENAIWHGIMPKKDGIGILELSFELTKDNIQIIITDNGIGRKAANENQKKEAKYHIQHNSIGIRNAKEQLQLTQVLLNKKTKLAIEDLFDGSNQPSGTKITITYPKIS